MERLHPPEWARPKGYSHGIKAEGPFIFVAGQIGWDEDQNFAGDSIVDRVRQALQNVVAILAEGGSGPDKIVRMTWYVVDKREYLEAQREIGEVYQEIIGEHYPAMTLFQVDELLEDEAKVEIEVTASG
jgi:enamine deaminase RidA (YjgF/YER057c/UK114 family)